MGKTKSKQNKSKGGEFDDKVFASKKSKKSKRSREVQVVTCPAAFPISNKPKFETKSVVPPPASRNNNNDKKNLLDWSETAREVHKLGATGFQGKQKKAHEDELYELLTGRKKKKPKMPLPRVRALRKRAQEREAEEIQAAKEAGIVLPKDQLKKEKRKKKDNSFQVHGPAPSVGFMKNGILRVNNKPR